MDRRGRNPTPQSHTKRRRASDAALPKNSSHTRCQLKRSVGTVSLTTGSDESIPAFYSALKGDSQNFKPNAQPDININNFTKCKPGSWGELPAWSSSSQVPSSLQMEKKKMASFDARSFSYWSRNTLADEGVVQAPLAEMWDVLLRTNNGFRQEMHSQGIISDTDYFTSSQLCNMPLASPPSSPPPTLDKCPSYQSLKPEHAPLKEITQATEYGQKNIEISEKFRRKGGASDNMHSSCLLAAQTQRRRKEVHDERRGLVVPESYAERARRRHEEHLRLEKDAFNHEPAAEEAPKRPWSEIDEQIFFLFQRSENPYQNLPSTTFSKEEHINASKEGYKDPNVLAFMKGKEAIEHDKKASVKNHSRSNTHFYRHPNLEIPLTQLPHSDRYRRASPGKYDVEASQPTAFIDKRIPFCIRQPSRNPYVENSPSINSNYSYTPMENAQEVSVAHAGPENNTPIISVNVGKEENASKISSGSEYHSAVGEDKPPMLSFYNRMLRANRPKEPNKPFNGKMHTPAISPVKSIGHPKSPTTPIKSSRPKTLKYTKNREHPLQSKWPSPPTPANLPPKSNPHGMAESSDFMRSPTAKRGRGNSLLSESPTVSRGSKGKGKVADPTLSPTGHDLAIASALRTLEGYPVLTARDRTVKSPPQAYVSKGTQTDDHESRHSEHSDENTFTETGLFHALLHIWPDSDPGNVLSALPEIMDPNLFSPGRYMPFYAGRRPIPLKCPKSHRYLAYLAERLAFFRTQLDDYKSQAFELIHSQREMENDLNMMQDERLRLSGENQVLHAYCKDLEKLLKYVSGQRATPEELIPAFPIAQRLGLTIPNPALASSYPTALAKPRDFSAWLSNVGDRNMKAQSKEMLDIVVENMKLQHEVETVKKEPGLCKHRSLACEQNSSREVGKAALGLYGDMGKDLGQQASEGPSTKPFPKHGEQSKIANCVPPDVHKARKTKTELGASLSSISPQQAYPYFADGLCMQPSGFPHSDSTNLRLGYPPTSPATNGPSNMPKPYGGPKNSH